ncbi:hypothetical protein [Streptomyces sp. NPDC001410]|uniref:hypothetical protein n=1 Tax=Streptomyces sp. NPDC001410 TaxID=3364574 RepID=UPI0036D1B8A5
MAGPTGTEPGRGGRMNAFYDSLSEQERTSAQDVAIKYGREVDYLRLLRAKNASTAPY